MKRKAMLAFVLALALAVLPKTVQASSAGEEIAAETATSIKKTFANQQPFLRERNPAERADFILKFKILRKNKIEKTEKERI